MIRNPLCIQTEEQLSRIGWCKSLGIKTRQNEGDGIRASNKLLFSWSCSNNVCMCSPSRSRAAVRTQDSDVFHHHHPHNHAAEAAVCFQSSQLKAAGKSKYNLCTYVCFFSTKAAVSRLCNQFAFWGAGRVFFPDLCWVVINNPFDVICGKKSMHNIIHDRGEAVCSISAASIFNDVDFFFPAE